MTTPLEQDPLEQKIMEIIRKHVDAYRINAFQLRLVIDDFYLEPIAKEIAELVGREFELLPKAECSECHERIEATVTWHGHACAKQQGEASDTLFEE